jgi:hypothetical protein
MPYTITKFVGENAFELNLSHFLGLFLVFNVELLWPYFPPFLDTSKVAKQLATTQLNHDCIEKDTMDWIMESKMKNTHQQNIHLYRVVKHCKWCSKKFTIFWRTPTPSTSGNMIDI